MNCIIVEDERDAVSYLEYQINKTGMDVQVLTRLASVEATVDWLRKNHTDLIFLDIQLSDGLSFEIFDHVQIDTPVIFTTSYDQYAVQAFEQNSISYLLKPVQSKHLKMALNKYERFFSAVSIQKEIAAIQPDYQQRFLVESGNVFYSIQTDDISYFHVYNGRCLVLVCKNGTQYLIEDTLERVEQRIDPRKFFRVNRQFIININAIQKMIGTDRGRLKVEVIPGFKDEIMVAVTKLSAFRDWLNR